MPVLPMAIRHMQKTFNVWINRTLDIMENDSFAILLFEASVDAKRECMSAFPKIKSSNVCSFER